MPDGSPSEVEPLAARESYFTRRALVGVAVAAVALALWEFGFKRTSGDARELVVVVTRAVCAVSGVFLLWGGVGMLLVHRARTRS